MKTLSLHELEYIGGGKSRLEMLKDLAYQLGAGLAVDGIIEGVRYVMDGEGSLTPAGGSGSSGGSYGGSHYGTGYVQLGQYGIPTGGTYGHSW